MDKIELEEIIHNYITNNLSIEIEETDLFGCKEIQINVFLGEDLITSSEPIEL
jgi:translation elongation factor EF-1beta